MKKLAIIITHPVQYYVPLFQLLAKECELKVFYTWGEDGARAKYDPDFKQTISWDIPLFEGYDFEFLINIAKNRGSHHYSGIVNPDLNKKISSFSADALLIYGWAYQSHLSAIRYFKGKIPLWFRGDSTLLDEKNIFKKIARSLFLKWVYKHIDIAFYVGTANRAYFRCFGLKEHQLIFAPHAVDNERFSVDRYTEASLMRKNLGIRVNETLILFAGKLEKKKSPDLLLQAFLDLKMENTHLLFVGNGELEESLKLKAKGQKPNIHFMDFRNQSFMPVIYQSCDLFCLPSQSETWGLAVNEAMAAGKAILISNKVGCSKDLIHRSNGYIFVASDHPSLQQNLKQIIRSDLNAMGQSSKQIISSWDFKHQVSAFIKALYAS